MRTWKVNCRSCKRVTNHDELFKIEDNEEIVYGFQEEVQ